MQNRGEEDEDIAIITENTNGSCDDDVIIEGNLLLYQHTNI